MTLAIASAPTLPLGEADVCAAQPAFAPGSPTNAYLMSVPPIVPWVCQPQYDVRNPLLVTSTDVSTKYTPFGVLRQATARDRAAHDRADLAVAQVRTALRVRVGGLARVA